MVLLLSSFFFFSSSAPPRMLPTAGTYWDTFEGAKKENKNSLSALPVMYYVVISYLVYILTFLGDLAHETAPVAIVVVVVLMVAVFDLGGALVQLVFVGHRVGVGFVGLGCSWVRGW